jgi:glycine cleavage system H protein
MANPKELKYTKSHEWVEFITDAQVAVGVTDYAQKQLSDIVFVNLPQVGNHIGVGDAVCDVESVKAVSEVYSPVEGVISAANEELLDSPSKINEAPYEAWLFKINEVAAKAELMTDVEYEAYCEAHE